MDEAKEAETTYETRNIRVIKNHPCEWCADHRGVGFKYCLRCLKLSREKEKRIVKFQIAAAAYYAAQSALAEVEVSICDAKVEQYDRYASGYAPPTDSDETWLITHGKGAENILNKLLENTLPEKSLADALAD